MTTTTSHVRTTARGHAIAATANPFADTPEMMVNISSNLDTIRIGTSTIAAGHDRFDDRGVFGYMTIGEAEYLIEALNRAVAEAKAATVAYVVAAEKMVEHSLPTKREFASNAEAIEEFGTLCRILSGLGTSCTVTVSQKFSNGDTKVLRTAVVS